MDQKRRSVTSVFFMPFTEFVLIWQRSMKKAIIVFQKYPKAGTVKTRLAKTIGADKAARLYAFLVRHTHQQLAGLDAAIFVFYKGPFSPEDYPGKRYRFQPQDSGDLGTKMKISFQQVFSMGFEQALIIGTDCFELQTRHMTEAFDLLQDKDLVLGPAVDGGYYLLGLRKPADRLFEDISWSTSAVLHQTLERAETEGLSVAFLEKLRDVDRYEDLGELKQLLPEL